MKSAKQLAAAASLLPLIAFTTQPAAAVACLTDSNTRQFSGAMCYPWATNDVRISRVWGTVSNEDTTVGVPLGVDCPIDRNEFYGSSAGHPAGCTNPSSHGGVTDTYIRFIESRHAPGDTLQCNLFAVKHNNSGGYSTFLLNSLPGHVTDADVILHIAGADGNYDQYTHLISCQIPEKLSTPDPNGEDHTIIYNYGVTEIGASYRY